ncbi:MAG: FRG domain-containing protein [Candidatus Thiodiazotropha sp.]
MEVETIQCIETYLTKVRGLERTGRVYRGVISEDYELIPKVGRDQYKDTYSIDNEKFLMRLFRQRAMPYIHHMPNNELEWMALAQHHGLPTRFLDWTVNPLVALFFATNSENNHNAAVYTSHFKRFDESFDPFGEDEPRKYYPPHITPRITAQEGLFTVQNEPTIAFDSDKILKIIIPADKKKEIRKELDLLGFNHQKLFPGLDGISELLSWRMEHRVGKW